jgi:3-dehydroquinate dehydratase-1
MTKENLLLSPGVGERVAIEMVRDTLSQHGSSIHSHTHPRSGSGYGYGKGESTPWFGDAGPESISAAALWMIIMGEELFARVQEQEKGKGVQRSRAGTATGAGATRTPKGGRGGIVDQWETWMARLQYLSLREDLNVEVREAAAEGAAVMRRV